jgi:hypothetical protein
MAATVAPDLVGNDAPALPGPAQSWAPGELPVGSALSGGSGGYPDTSGLFSDLKEAAQKKYGVDSYLYNTYSDQLDRDRGRMQHAFDKESAAADDPALTHPWNADQQRADRIRGPLEQFGSVGMIFALAGSAFSKTPMVSALNAGAAAMNAMRQSDELGYKSAYEAWKANTDLAVKRFDIERAVYEDANKLATTDVATWRTKMAAAAAQFDNQKILAMLDHGMDAEVFKTIEAQTQARDQVVKYQQDMQDLNLTSKIGKTNFEKWKEANPPPPATPNKNSPEELKYGLDMRVAENQALVDAKRQVAQSKSQARGNLSPNQQLYEMIRQKYEGDPDAEEKIADEYGRAIRNQRVAGGAGAGGSTSLTSDRQHAADTQKIIDDEVKSGKLDGNDPKAVAARRKEIESQYGGKPITGNEKVKLEQRVDKFKHSEETIDKTLKVLETYTGAAGIAGKTMRLEERLSNLAGSDNTARVQMMRDVELLRAWGQELLFNSRGKLKEEGERINSIVGGTSAGDTGPNTIRALRDLKKLYKEMQAEDQSRLSGTWTGGSSEPSKPSPGKSPWSSDPIVGR